MQDDIESIINARLMRADTVLVEQLSRMLKEELQKEHTKQSHQESLSADAQECPFLSRGLPFNLFPIARVIARIDKASRCN